MGSNAALRNRPPVAPPPCLRDSSAAPTRRAPTRPCVCVASRSRLRPECTAPCSFLPP